MTAEESAIGVRHLFTWLTFPSVLREDDAGRKSKLIKNRAAPADPIGPHA